MFTFKTENPTGRYRSFHDPVHLIKLKKEEVGTIGAHPPFPISLKVKKAVKSEDGNPNCAWKWVTLARKSESLKDAKNWLNSVFEQVVQKYTLWIEPSPAPPPPVYQKAIDELDKLTDAERAEVFNHYCRHCGSKDVHCQCRNDD